MSASWVSRFLAARPAALFAAALALTLAAGDAGARVRVLSRAKGDTGAVTTQVRISDRGIVVRHSGADSVTGVIVADSLGTGEILVDHGAGIVRLFSDASVKPGETVDGDVVAVFGNVHVAGKVTGSAVAVFGSIDLTPEASVGEDAVAVGGGVDDPPGSHIAGQTVQVGIMPLTLGLPALPVMLAFLFLGWLVSVFFGWVFAALFPERLARVAGMSSRRTAASLAIGILTGPLVPVVAVLLMVTVIGLPIGLMMPFVYVAVVYAGQLAALHVLGCKLLRRPLDSHGVAPIAAGGLLVALFFVIGSVFWGSPGALRTIGVFFDLFGVLMLATLSCIGTGAFLLSRAGSRGPGESGAAAEPPAAHVSGATVAG